MADRQNRFNAVQRNADEERTFKDEFYEHVNVRAILSGSSIVGRNEARLMICQFRGCAMDRVLFTDPAVLMLDGMSLDSLNSFLEAAPESLIETLKGDEEANLPANNNKNRLSNTAGSSTNLKNTSGSSSSGGGNSGSGNDKKNVSGDNNKSGNVNNENNEQDNKQMERTTVAELSRLLTEFKQASDPTTRAKYRDEFFTCYTNLDVVHRLAIPPQERSIIEQALGLGPSNQEMILRDLNMPDNAMARLSQYDGGNYGDNTNAGVNYGEGVGLTVGGGTGSTRNSNAGNWTNTALYGEIGSGKARTDREPVAELAGMEAKNLRAWICGNWSSSHVWFFICGIFLTLAFGLQIWVNYAYGEIWRAILMEMLTMMGVLTCVLEADTPYIRNNVQSKIYVYYQFLRNVKGRTAFYAIIVFLAFGEFSDHDTAAVTGGFVLLLLLLLRLYYYNVSNSKFTVFVKNMPDSDFARQKFNQFDHESKGYLQVSDMSKIANVSGCCTRWLYETMFWCMDSQTNDGQVDVHEFVQFCLRFKERSEMQEALRKERMYYNQQYINSSNNNNNNNNNRKPKVNEQNVNVYGNDNNQVNVVQQRQQQQPPPPPPQMVKVPPPVPSEVR